MPTSLMISLEPSTLDGTRVSVDWQGHNSLSLSACSGNPRKLPLDILRDKGFNRGSPYSLGKPVEWKPMTRRHYLLSV